MKSYTCAEADRPLFLATEKGYLAIPGIMAVDIKSWGDFLTAIAQLKKPEAQERYKTIVIDTLDNLAFLAIEDILQKKGVNSLSEIAYGGGYTILETMFRKAFKELTERYGVMIIAHPNQKQDDNEEKTRYWDLAVNKKVKAIAVGLMDLLIFVERTRDHNELNIAHFKPTEQWEAKTRFSNIVSSVPLSYANICKAVKDATGSNAVAKVERNISQETEYSIAEFQTIKDRVNALAQELVISKGLEPVKNKINFILAKPLQNADIADTERLLLLESELKEL